MNVMPYEEAESIIKKQSKICTCSGGALHRFTPVSRVWSFQQLSSGGIPAPSAFSREEHSGAAVSPTAKALK